jgi:hypothetical protein
MANVVKIIGMTMVAVSVVVFLVSPIAGVGMFLGAVAGYALANIID